MGAAPSGRLLARGAFHPDSTGPIFRPAFSTQSQRHLMIIIGLTGRNAAGKTTAGEMLGARGFAYLSLSDAIREEAKKRAPIRQSLNHLDQVRGRSHVLTFTLD